MRRLIASLSAAWLAFAGALLLGLASGSAVAQTPSKPNLPQFTGLVVDAANVLPPQTKADLTAKLEALQRDTKRQLVVATIPDLQGYPLEDYGNRLIRGWGVGLKGVDNGAILFIAPNEPPGHRGPRVEVGYGLEPVLTDALSSVIINQDMMPKLKAGDIAGAMTAGTDALIQQLRANPDEAKARTDAAIKQFDATHRRSTGSRGGGVPIGLIFWGVILLFVVVPLVIGRRRQSGPWGRRYDGDGGGSGMLPIVLWSIANEIGRAASDRYGDDRGGGWGGGGGGGSDGSWGGGGFTGGGGGSGGGGGASGSW